MKNRSSWFVWTAFCNLILITGIYERTIKVDGAVTPSINDDGTINWGMFDPIPKSNLELSFDDIKHPKVLSDMSQGFVDFVVHGLPYETIRNVLIDLNDNGEIEDIGATAGELILGFIGVVILVLIGILLFFLVPFIGFCFCCCRCCGNCGGKREQVDSSLGCKRVTLSIIFVALLGILGAGMALTNTANDFQKDSLLKSDVALNTISDGVLNYTSDVLKQVKFMVDDQYGFVDELLRTNLIENTLATDVTTYIKQDLKLEEVTDDLDKLSEDLQSVETSFKNINEERSELIEQDNILKNNLTVIEQRIEAVKTSCPTCDIPEFNSQVNGNIPQLPEISQDQIGDVNGGVETVDEFNQKIDDALGDIEATISDETNQTAYEVIGELDEIQKIIDENFKTVEDVLNDVNDAVKDVQKGYEENLDSINNWLNYRWLFFLGVSCSILFVLVLMILGFTMGTICYRKGSPRERSSCSNCGGNCLMWTVFFMFVLFPILILLTCAMFAGFSLATATCTPLETFEIFEETIDYPNTLTDGYWLGDIIYGNGSYEVTISGMLEACKDDETLYKAIKLDYLIDFDEMKKKFEDLEGQLDGLVGDIEDISLDLDGIIPPDLQNDLNNLISQVGIDDFDAEAYQALLPNPVLNGTDYLTSYADELDEIAAANPNQTKELNDIAEDLRSLQISVVDPMSQSVAHIESNITTVEHVNETLPSSIDSTLQAAAEVEAAVSSVNETELVVNITEVYIKSVVNVGESYYDETTHQIENDFAKCYNVYDIYSTGLFYTCGYVLSSGNALWFTIGWSVFFFLPSIIFSVKLAKHYRIMKKVRPPKQKKQTNNRNREDFGMNEMQNGNGHDERLLYPHRYGGGGMTPVDNPQFIPDEGPIMAYDYKGNPIAPPPAYNHGNRNNGYTEYQDPPAYRPDPRGQPGRGPNPNPYARGPSASIDMRNMNPVYDDMF
ncbi:prominin-1-A-like isoform X2 [Apostichopus japonicus]|uniref:prominin-1-A-like isoform X2 n=1 Tax=Stichopus japonicus TaxID=307972 RepID=UPI003AB3F695